MIYQIFKCKDPYQNSLIEVVIAISQMQGDLSNNQMVEAFFQNSHMQGVLSSSQCKKLYQNSQKQRALSK